jgi:hypothetical protein
MHYTVTSPDPSLRSSSRHLEDAINSFARKFLGFQSSLCWTRTPGATTGAKEVRLCTGNSHRSPNDAVLPFHTLWLFDPRERYEQLMGQLENNLPDEAALQDCVQEIAVLIPMIRDLSLAGGRSRQRHSPKQYEMPRQRVMHMQYLGSTVPALKSV